MIIIIMMQYFIDLFGEIIVGTAANQYMSALLQCFGVLSIDTSTRS